MRSIKQLIINSKQYRVEEMSEDCSSTGLSFARDLWIKYNKSQPDEQLKDTLLHEVIHIIDYDGQLGLSEQQVHSLATQLYSFFHSNKEFAEKFIT